MRNCDIRLGVEDIEPNLWVAFVLDHPGCFSSATTHGEAVANALARIAEYFEWLSSYDCARPRPGEPIDMKVVEVFHAYPSHKDPDYVVNALFEDDCKPLTREGVEAGLAIYDCAVHDLNALVNKISAAQFTQPLTGHRKSSPEKILEHVVWAEWWYLDRLGLAFPRSEMRGDVLTRLEKVRAQTRAQLPNLVGDTRITDEIDEKWSACKVLRRTLWHVRDHTQQIKKLMGY